MFILDYSTDFHNRDIETTTFNVTTSIVDFIADKSSMENFKLERINKYEGGKLYPYEITLNHGRIAIVAGASATPK